jgi:hypothetical protein
LRITINISKAFTVALVLDGAIYTVSKCCDVQWSTFVIVELALNYRANFAKGNWKLLNTMAGD